MKIAFTMMLMLVAGSVHAAEGLISVKSANSVSETISRLEATAKEKGLKIFARIDHAAGAAKIGKLLRPTELLIFGNPKGGTPLMECAQTVGIDLPLKALAWEDAAGQVWLGYNDPQYIMRRHEQNDCGTSGAEYFESACGSCPGSEAVKSKYIVAGR
jgi:uncharacterized protein (DUF302 family)